MDEANNTFKLHVHLLYHTWNDLYCNCPLNNQTLRKKISKIAGVFSIPILMQAILNPSKLSKIVNFPDNSRTYRYDALLNHFRNHSYNLRTFRFMFFVINTKSFNKTFYDN